jgi:hypothetical protein
MLIAFSILRINIYCCLEIQKMKKILSLNLATVAAVALLSFGSASASVVLSDNFNAENGGTGTLNYTGLANWTVTGGSVDLIGNGYFDLLPGNGLYLDMNGSTGAAGAITSVATFGPGTYNLTFDFAGTQRGYDGKISFTFGDATGGPVTLSSGTGFTPESFVLTTTLANSQLTFQSYNTGNGNIGGLLDNVVLTSRSDVPEPASLSLLGLGLVGLGLMHRRKRA